MNCRAYNLGQFGNKQGAGNPSLVYGIYAGPPGQGLEFAPGFASGRMAWVPKTPASDEARPCLSSS